jgi:hypothetical protein
MTYPTIDMRSRLAGARDQGARPTCLAFAVSDAHAAAARSNELFSADYLHFFATKRANVGVNDGVGISAVRAALELDGQPLESTCPYADPRANGWTPAAAIGAIWKRNSSLCLGAPSDVLNDAVANGRVHVLVLRISRSFFLPDPSSHLVAEDGDPVRRLHAVAVVGASTVDGVPAFLTRNSWGASWGLEGHAWVPLTYVDARAIEIVAMEG